MDKTTAEWQLGEWGEKAVRHWLASQGFGVLPASLATTGGAAAIEQFWVDYLRSPDIIAFKQNRACWVEVKTKSKSVPSTLRKRDEHGIDEAAWREYVLGQQLTVQGYIAIVQLAPRQLLLGAIDDIVIGSFLSDSPKLPEPRRFFDVRRFDWYTFGDGWLRHNPPPSPPQPNVDPRPWEPRYRNVNRQPPLL